MQIRSGEAMPINWGATNPGERGLIIGNPADTPGRNAMGLVHNAPNMGEQGLAPFMAQTNSGEPFDPHFIPRYGNGEEVYDIGSRVIQRGNHNVISFDPFGQVTTHFRGQIEDQLPVQPSVASVVTTSEIEEVKWAMDPNRADPLLADGKILNEHGEVTVTKIKVASIWHLPGVAKRLGVGIDQVRESLYQTTLIQELRDRPELEVFVPPSAGFHVYIIGDPKKVGDPKVMHVGRIHDACFSSDVMGSGMCTCRPYLMHALINCIRRAQDGGVGIIIYNQGHEAKATSEVKKLAIYRQRMADPEGNVPSRYYEWAERLIGGHDFRPYFSYPDFLQSQGVTVMDEWYSKSAWKLEHFDNMRINSMVTPSPLELPRLSLVEEVAKILYGHYTPNDDLLDECIVACRQNGLAEFIEPLRELKKSV